MTQEFRKSIKVWVALIGGCLQMQGQAPPNVTQDATNSPCANIVAIAGDVTLNCSTLTPTQQRLLASIPALLKQIIADQVNPTDLMSILRDLKSGQVRIENGVLRIENSVREVQEQQTTWELTDEQAKLIKGKLVGHHAFIEINAISADKNAHIFASGLASAIIEYNTNPAGAGISVNYGLNPAIMGIRMLAATIAELNAPDVLALGKALTDTLGFKIEAGTSNADERLVTPGKIFLVVGAKPTASWLATHKP